MNIERAYATKIDDLGLDSFFCELFSSFHTVCYHLAMCYDGYVASFPLNFGFAYRDEEVVGHSFLGHWERYTVKHFVFKENNWTGVADGRLITVARQ